MIVDGKVLCCQMITLVCSLSAQRGTQTHKSVVEFRDRQVQWKRNARTYLIAERHDHG